MPSYKFTYFDGRGRGELTRYVFHAAGKDFEDNRITFENWPPLKASMPFGQMPLLEIDGKKLAQSNAIARFVAREFGLAGKDSWEQAQIDQYMELANDMFDKVVKWYFERDEEKKKELAKNLDEEVYPKFCGMFQKSLEQNGGDFFVGKSLTLADLAVLALFDTPVHHSPKVLDAFPKLKAHRDRIATTPNLAKYIKDRPVTPI